MHDSHAHAWLIGIAKNAQPKRSTELPPPHKYITTYFHKKTSYLCATAAKGSSPSNHARKFTSCRRNLGHSVAAAAAPGSVAAHPVHSSGYQRVVPSPK